MRLTSLTQSRAEQIVMLGRLSMVSEREGAVHSLSLDGELDLANADKVDQELRRVEAGDADVILVDLWDVSFIDSTGIRVLLTAAARCRHDGRLVIERANPLVLRVLHLAGVSRLLPLCG
jgi:anti-anti-sigma factor